MTTLTVAKLVEAYEIMRRAQVDAEVFHAYVSPAKANEAGLVDGQLVELEGVVVVKIHVDATVSPELDGVVTSVEIGPRVPAAFDTTGGVGA